MLDDLFSNGAVVFEHAMCVVRLPDKAVCSTLSV